MRRHSSFVLVGVLTLAASAVAGELPRERARTIVCVELPVEPAWQDFAFLAAIPAAASANDGVPVVLAEAPDAASNAQTADFVRRYRPQRELRIGATADDERNDTREHVDGADAVSVACELATRCFATSPRAVVCRDDDYARALCAAVLAARWRAPLFFSSSNGLSALTRTTLGELGVRSVCFVGERADSSAIADAVPSVERLEDAIDVAHWLQRHSLAVDYVAATAANDRTSGRVRKLSLAAATLAAGRGGALLPIEFESGGGEPPTPATFAARIERTQTELARLRIRLGRAPEALCLVALPESIPMVAEPCGQGIDADPVSDLPYANVDDDPFVELALGRVIAEDAASATLLAARSLAYDELVEPTWSGRVAIAEWERQAASVFARAGFDARLVEPAGAALQTGSPFAEIAALVHASHSSWLGLGSTYAADSTTLLAPCVVETGGCSAASLDQDPEGRSVAARLLRNGAVGFVGNTRRAVAQYELYRSELWNALLGGATLGRAHRRALNCMVAALLDRDDGEQGLYRYELHAAALYGDPALAPRLVAERKLGVARAELRGGELVLHAPTEWLRSEVFAPEDWQRDASHKILTLRGGGVGVESRWNGEQRRNHETLVFTAEVRTERRVNALEPLDPPKAPLGSSGRFFVDEHADGTRSLFLRARFVDFDMDEGRFSSSVDTLRFRVK
ncbi:MAG: C25 family cysteine peptidase [Planctomycetes bacterium]|nr:C25 family cysteine peptidase [Planctomycetota bacterium]